jgi:hypothetical protein
MHRDIDISSPTLERQTFENKLYGSVHLQSFGTFCVPERLIEPRFVRAGLFALEERKF